MKSIRRLPPGFATPLTPCNCPVRRCPVPRDAASKRILVMRLGAHGDILMGTPLLAALREAYPDAHLTWVAEHSQSGAIEANPFIDEILVWDSMYWREMVRRALYPLWLLRALRFRQALRARCYDLFISLHPEKWPLFVEGVGASVSVGVFDTNRTHDQAVRTSRRTRFYTHALSRPSLPEHRLDQFLLPLKALGIDTPGTKAMTMGFTASDTEKVAHHLRAQGISADESYVVLVPGTTWPSKRWPAARYAELGDQLAMRRQRIILIGSEEDAEIVRRVASHMQQKPVTAAGVLNFREVAALVSKAKLVVSGDTGPMHVAAAVGTPFLTLFGPTSPRWYAPPNGAGVHIAHSVPCGPCHHKYCPNKKESHLLCQRLITVAEVVKAASDLLTTEP